MHHHFLSVQQARKPQQQYKQTENEYKKGSCREELPITRKENLIGSQPRLETWGQPFGCITTLAWTSYPSDPNGLHHHRSAGRDEAVAHS